MKLDDDTMTIGVPFPTDMRGNPLTPRDVVSFVDSDGIGRRHAIEGLCLVMDDDDTTEWDVIGHAHWQLDLGSMGTIPADETIIAPMSTSEIGSVSEHTSGRDDASPQEHDAIIGQVREQGTD